MAANLCVLLGNALRLLGRGFLQGLAHSRVGLVDTFDIRAKGAQLFNNVFIAALDMSDLAHFRHTIRCKRRHYKRRPGALTGAGKSSGTPSITATRPSTCTLAPMRASSAT